jgi:arylsulfatase A-like enzyme
VYAPHDPATPAPRHADLFSDVRAPRSPSFNEHDVSDKPNHVRNRPPLGPLQIKAIDNVYRRRLQSLQAVDDAIGSVIDTLKESKQLENTFIFFTSDNGYHLGQHRMPAGKVTAYEEDIRVPLVVRGPKIPAASRRTNMTGNIDLAPTFAELAGVKSPAFVDGRSLVPLFTAEPPPFSWRQVFLLAHWSAASQDEPLPGSLEEPADFDDQYREESRSGSTPLAIAPRAESRPHKRILAPVRVPEFQGLRTADHTYVEYITGEKELYDNRRDPYQLQNRAAKAEAPLLKDLAERLNEMRNCAGPSCRAAEDKPFRFP